MFGLPYTQYVHGSALRTWNFVSRFANVLWFKFNHLRAPIMPRSRRRHHSRSRSRSRSHSHDRDREPKRRKIESYESPHQRRSVSSQPEDSTTDTTSISDRQLESCSASTTSLYETAPENTPTLVGDISGNNTSGNNASGNNVSGNNATETDASGNNASGDNTDTANSDEGIGTEDTNKENEEHAEKTKDEMVEQPEESVETAEESDDCIEIIEQSDDHEETKPDEAGENEKVLVTPSKPKTKVDAVKVTPTRRLTPKQLEKQKESEKKKQERQKEREERERKRQEEKEQKRLKLEQKQKEKEEKLKELEQKRKEKEEKEEQKRKEKEQEMMKKQEEKMKREQERMKKQEEKIKKQQEIEEKTREKQKLEEQKQKAAAAFTKFFVAKKVDGDKKEKDGDRKGEITAKNQNFMPFEKKADMKLAPIMRASISEERKSDFDQSFVDQSSEILYLAELKSGKKARKSGKTWPVQESGDDDDVMIIGESIEEEKPKLEKMRTKFLSFTENQRPPYYGTFRKKSNTIIPTKPFQKDENLFNYDVDSEQEWEDEGEGESLKGTDDEDDEECNESDEDKENDYLVDNKFFVPHGHLSDDEIDDEAEAKLSPESHKAKLKLLKNEFDEERKSKQHKLKPSVIGCIWYSKVRTKAEEAFDRYLQPFGVISNGRIEIKPRSEIILTNTGRSAKALTNEHIPIFLRYVHASVLKPKDIVKGFLEHLSNIGVEADVSQLALGKQLKQFADCARIKDNGAKRRCWIVKDEIQRKFDLSLPSKKDLENNSKGQEVSPEK